MSTDERQWVQEFDERWRERREVARCARLVSVLEASGGDANKARGAGADQLEHLASAMPFPEDLTDDREPDTGLLFDQEINRKVEERRLGKVVERR